MEHLIDNQIHYTPPEHCLYPFPQLKCTVDGCTAVFNNSSNLAMHLQKRHKVLIPNGESKTTNKLFHCPHESCIYNISQQDGKHFTCLKYLRQHFQKVHAIKNYSCDKCCMAFGTEGSLKSHQLHRCGKVFECVQCGLQFAQREALLMHAKRKGHMAPVKTGKNSKEKLNIGKSTLKTRITRIKSGNQQTQTEERSTKVATVQTDGICYDVDKTKSADINENLINRCHEGVNNSYNLKQIDFASFYCDTETQTDISCSSNIPCFSNVTPLLDQMLSHSSHMHTQTCDDFLTELGLADIQTQTNWSNLNTVSSGDEVDLHIHDHSHSHDELFVSAETQTSFTQCLLDNTDSAFNSLCNTQHTQTCDTLLGGLFGGQDSDFMGTFQSAYTQT